MFDPRDTATSGRIERVAAKLGAAPARRAEAPLRAISELARRLGDLAPDAADPLGRRRHREAAARLARTAVDAAAAVHATFGVRPDLAVARGIAVSQATERARDPRELPQPAAALAVCAQIVLDLPALSDEDEDWQLAAIAFADEAALRRLHDALVVLAAAGIRAAAA